MYPPSHDRSVHAHDILMLLGDVTVARDMLYRLLWTKLLFKQADAVVITSSFSMIKRIFIPR